MWVVFNLSLLVQFDLNFFLSRFSGLVWFVADLEANTFEDPFYILRFDRRYSAKPDGAESLMMKGSEARKRLKLLNCYSAFQPYSQP